jgi:hypothetical protein
MSCGPRCGQYRYDSHRPTRRRFSEAKQAADWSQVADALASAELYWLTTVRKDGRPHTRRWWGRGWTTVRVLHGPEEQKAQNLAHSAAVTVTTGVNTWNDGLDVVVEGDAQRVTGLDTLTRLADEIREKYHGVWDFTPHEDGFGHTDESGDSHIAYVFLVPPAKVLAFAKSPHGQTRFRP